MLLRFLVGFILSALIGALGFRRGSLSRGGALGAILTGTLIFGCGGIVPGVLLVAFFISSSALSQYRAQAKAGLAEKFQKGSRRDLGQALANGGWAAALTLPFVAGPQAVLFAAFVGALAAVTADTWATEIGVLSSRPPRLITTGERVAVGTSGGVTPLGVGTCLLGGVFIGLTAVASSAAVLALPAWISSPWLAAPVVPTSRVWLALPLLGAASGFCGSLFDSLLGATVQAMYYCDYDRKVTERRLHTCGRATRRVRGAAWLDNDVVNFLASVLGSVVAAVLWVQLLPS